MGSCIIYKGGTSNCIQSKMKSAEIDNHDGDDLNRSANFGPDGEDNNPAGGNGVIYEDDGEHSFRMNWDDKKSKKGFFSSLDSCPTDSMSMIEIPILDIKFLSFSEPQNLNSGKSCITDEPPEQQPGVIKKKNKPNLKLNTADHDMGTRQISKVSSNVAENTHSSMGARQVMTTQGSMNRLRKSETIKEHDSPDKGFHRKDSTVTDKAPKGILKSPSIKKQKTMGRMASEGLQDPELYSPKTVSFKKKVMVKKYKTNSAIRKSLKKVNVDDTDNQDSNPGSIYEPNQERGYSNTNLMRQRKSNQV